MTFATWHEPVRLLDERTGPATDQQRELANTIGLPLAGTEPKGIAAVMLEEQLQPLIWGEVPEPATDRQRAFLVELGSREADDARLTRRSRRPGSDITWPCTISNAFDTLHSYAAMP